MPIDEDNTVAIASDAPLSENPSIDEGVTVIEVAEEPVSEVANSENTGPN